MATVKNIMNPFSSTMRGRVPATAFATAKVLPEAAVFSLINDFDADDSGAMAHVIDEDERGTHIVRTLGGEHRRNFASFNFKDLTGITADDPHEAFLVAFKTLIAAPWPLMSAGQPT